MLCGFCSGALTFYCRDLALLLQLLCSVSSATLTRFFSHFAPLLREGARGKEEAPPALEGECGRGFLFPQGADDMVGEGRITSSGTCRANRSRCVAKEERSADEESNGSHRGRSVARQGYLGASLH